MLFGFDAGVRKKLLLYEESKAAVIISNCEVRDVQVVGVMQLNKYVCCINCNTKITPDAEESDLGHCSKCDMTQCIDNCSNGITTKFIYFACIWKNDIADKPANEMTNTTLLQAKPFKMIHMIQSVSRKP